MPNAKPESKKPTQILKEQYLQETTDGNEPKLCQRLGPLHPEALRDDDNNVIRIPYSGFIDAEGTEFELVGFGSLDKRRRITITFTTETTTFLQSFLGKAYAYNFLGKQEMKSAVFTLLNEIGLTEFKRRLRALPKDTGSLMALEIVLGMREGAAVQTTKPEPSVAKKPRASSIGDDPD